MERKRSDGTDGGYRWEGYMSRWTVNPIPEDRGGLGCKILVTISLTLALGGGRRMQDG